MNIYFHYLTEYHGSKLKVINLVFCKPTKQRTTWICHLLLFKDHIEHTELAILSTKKIELAR